MIGFLIAPVIGTLIAVGIILIWRKLMAISIADFTAEIEQTEGVQASVVALLGGVVARIQELVAANAGLDAFAALAQRLDASTNALAAAAEATTAALADPATPPVEEPPVEEPPVEEPPVEEPPVEEPPVEEPLVVDAAAAKRK